MANQRQSFFRFRWFGEPNPTPPTRPTQETRTPAPMTAALAGQRAAFSPAGIAPTQPTPSQPSKTEPQDQPASQPPSEFRVTSQPQSPSRAPKESRATSQPPSPSRAPKESRATSQPSSPSRPKTRTPSSPSRAASPSKSPSKPQQPDSQTASSQPQSPSRLASQSVRYMTSLQVTSPSRLQPKAEVVSEYKEGSQPQSSETQREEKVAESQPPLQQPQMKMEIASEKTQVAKDESPKKTTSQADNGGEKVTAQASDSVATPSPSQQEDKAALSQPALTQVAKTESPKKTTSQADNYGEKGTAQASQEEDKAAVSQSALQESQPKIEIRPDQTSISPLKTTSQDEDDREATKAAAISPKEVAESTGDQKTLSKLEEESKPERAEEEEKTVEELPKEEKTKSPAYEEPVQKTVTQHIPTVTTGRRIVAFPKERWPQKQETSDKENKEATTTTTTNYIGRQIKTVSSSGNTSNTSFHKPFSSAADEQAPRQKEIKEDISKLVHKPTTEHQLVEIPVSVINLTGENRGASMNVSSESAKKEESIHIHRGYKLNPDDSAETTTDGEVNNTQGRRFRDHLSREAPPAKAYANSNVQSVNNSIVFNSSVNGRNPGIHLEFSRDDAEPTGINGRSESHQVRRAEISITF